MRLLCNETNNKELNWDKNTTKQKQNKTKTKQNKNKQTKTKQKNIIKLTYQLCTFG